MACADRLGTQGLCVIHGWMFDHDENDCWQIQHDVRLRRTMELNHAGPPRWDNPRLPGKPETLPGVGSSDLVRRRAHSVSNISGEMLPTRRGSRPCRDPSQI
jgi:hypothetical protein